MTDAMMNLRTFVEKTPDADLLREMIGFAAEKLMEIEVGAATGAGYGEKSSLRMAQRNGYRDRDWETRAGTVELRIPRLSRGSCFPGFLEPRRLSALLTSLPGDRASGGSGQRPDGREGARRRHPGSLRPRVNSGAVHRPARSMIWSRPWA